MATISFHNVIGPTGPVAIGLTPPENLGTPWSFQPLAAFATLLGGSANVASWSDGETATLANTVHVIGEGFSYGASGRLLDGVVHSLAIYDSEGDAFMTAFGLDASARRLCQDEDTFWNHLLRGADTINVGASVGVLAADRAYAGPGEWTTRGDVVNAIYDTDVNQYLCGDVFELKGGTDAAHTAILHGGDDSFNAVIAADASGFAFLGGDVLEVSDQATLDGGNDRIDITGASSSLSMVVAGDAAFANGEGDITVNCGNDVLTYRLTQIDGQRANFTGDIFSTDGPGTGRVVVNCGDDRIVLSSNATAVGDVYFAYGAIINCGDDRLIGSEGNDALYGDVGTVDAESVVTGGDDILRGRGGDDLICGDFDELSSMLGFDSGVGGNDFLSGGDGDDTLYGNGGDDQIFGGAGADFINGGDGADTMRGGQGDDTFEFKTVEHSARGATDVIADFGVAGGDVIDLSYIDADASDGVVAWGAVFAFIGSAGFSAAGQLRLVRDGDDILVRCNVDADLAADMQIRLKGAGADGLPALSELDFIL